MRVICILILSFWLSPQVKAQANNYKPILDSVLEAHNNLFVRAKPITFIDLDKKLLREYYFYFKDLEKKKLDTLILSQIIHNLRFIDTAQWTDAEFDKVFLINDPAQNLQLEYAKAKFKLTQSKDIKTCKKFIDQFNTMEPNDRSITCFSRPVFDDSRQYAIIQWDNAHGQSAGGGIILYQLVDDSWTQLGTIWSWKY